MEAYARGDRTAFDPLFNALAPRVLAFFQHCLPDPSLAEDLLQRTFVQLHSQRQTYRPGTRLRPWLYGIAVAVGIAELHAPSDTRSPAAHSGKRDDAARAAFDNLHCSQRVVIYLHRFEALNFADIAQILGATENTIRVRAIRSYSALRANLQALVAEGGAP